MSQLLDTLIQQRREEALAYELYLAKVVELTRQVQNPARTSSYPKTMNTPARRALYDNLEQDEILAVAIDEEIRSTKKDGWRGNRIKEREVRYAIRKHIPDVIEAEYILELAKNQSEY
jgi:type I restriction enzyme R subunit